MLSVMEPVCHLGSSIVSVLPIVLPVPPWAKDKIAVFFSASGAIKKGEHAPPACLC